ncbi:TonB-dependent receptor [Chitinimonas arctica]|uniref:TonB-dependent receptor n=1 Tax=Chitinimonas arctica TaxID=2594795 RepID=A0A516SHW6_9NEIS|nr:TonB-dependent receptor [Chitinimonas arctica]QDQ27752.1 TonB-dependent receptor [Chitinimonas arctica]
MANTAYTPTGSSNGLSRRSVSTLAIFRYGVRSIHRALLPLTVSIGLCVGVQARPLVLADLSLEQLANFEITSVSKRRERLADAAASVFAISQDDIRRSGANSLPEALRLAPNLQVAAIDAYQYAISARGFNTSTSNKLQVLIDGRIVYTPLYSGVFWDAQDVMMRDIDRIEVISGPGAIMWGANAVNGVINIITRRAEDSVGELGYFALGGKDRHIAARHGGRLDSGAPYRIYAKYRQRTASRSPSGRDHTDDWEDGRFGFRTDWGNAEDGFTLQGDSYRASLAQALPGRRHTEGSNLQGQWNRQLNNGSALRLQGYYDHSYRDYPGLFKEKLDIIDLEWQHTVPLDDERQVSWGGSYRQAWDKVENSKVLAFLPAHRRLRWFDLFVQGETKLAERLRLTAGARLASNSYTHFDFMPSVRLAWKRENDALVWGGISRTARAPSRIDRDFFAPSTPPFQYAGGPEFQSEIANTVELGYREQPSTALSYSLTAHYSRYRGLRSQEMQTDRSVQLGNGIDGSSRGLEAWGSYQATPSWRLSAGASTQRQHFRHRRGLVLAPNAVGIDPRWQWKLRSSLNLGSAHELDLFVRHIGALHAVSIPAYTAVDLRLAYQPNRHVELSLKAQNLFDRGHAEFRTSITQQAIEAERTITAALTINY